jgi:CelD/BcsL family acetyltransferase involved in cellulose biosynthesis/RimJ/RimL family protein N-acetyltransferase
MTIELASGESGKSLLRDASFIARWRDLYDQCAWATAFQSVEFVCTWFDVYGAQFAPILIFAWGADGSLDGLLALAVSIDCGTVEIAGADRAEYQGWLARRGSRHAFIIEALDRFRALRPDARVVFQYLPPGTPYETVTTDPRWSKLCRIEPFDAPIMNMSRGAAVSTSRLKKTSKSLGRLDRIAPTRFERIDDAKELASAMDHIAVQYDLRQGAINDYLHFHADPLSRAFQLALMQTGLLHATVLRHGGLPIAANLGLRGKGTVHLGIFSHSATCARESPGKLLLVLLGEHVSQGSERLDLTPGEDAYKRSFANEFETVYRLTLFTGRFARRRDDVRRALAECVKRGVRAAGGDPAAVRRQAQRALRTGVRRLVSRTVSRVARALWSHEEVRVYAVQAEGAGASEDPKVARRDVTEDLLAYEPVPGFSTREEFLSRALNRLQDGHHVYTRVENGRLVHYGWMAEAQYRAELSEVGQELSLPPGSTAVYEYFTHPVARGRGLYQQSLRQMMREAAAVPGTKWIFIWVTGGNAPSRHVIEKAGFEYRGSAFQRTVLGRTRRWNTLDPQTLHTSPMPIGGVVSREAL